MNTDEHRWFLGFLVFSPPGRFFAIAQNDRKDAQNDRKDAQNDGEDAQNDGQS
jgi:hypothetical protein